MGRCDEQHEHDGCDAFFASLAARCPFPTPIFSGKDLSYVDLMFTPFLERMSASLPYYKGLRVRGNPRWPNIDKYEILHGLV